LEEFTMHGERWLRIIAYALSVVCLASFAGDVAALDLVRNGKPVATIVVASSQPESGSRSRRRGPVGDARAAEVLVDWVRKMTDAELPVADTPPTAGPVVYVGAAAIEAGLKLADIESPSREGLRIRCDGRRLLIAGQDDTATVKAVCRFLEELGCRYFVDHPIGEVFPRTKNLTVGRVDITDRPGFLMRSIWGSQWSGQSLWKIWNGAGGIRFSTGHSWGRYVPKDLFKDHPEFFQFRDGERRPSDWYCTSNAGLRKVFGDALIEHIRSGATYPSISPPDGRGYCQCDACRRQDDPKSTEPTTGTVAITNRYLDFYQDVAKRVSRECPDAILSFYCYADYTQAPTSGIKLAPNLCAWIAPIRYCRYHRIAHPNCPSRAQLDDLLDDWAAAASKIAYRTYNYNLAECCVPFSLLSVWEHDIPYLKEKGCVGINLETLTNWQIYGPHIYLSIRLAYDPSADADAIMDDYYQSFYGPKAGSVMKEYWRAIDEAFDRLDCHTGSFFALHLVYSPEFLKQCQGIIGRASAAAREDKTYAARVDMAREGLRNAEEFIAVRDAMNRGDFRAAKTIYDRLLERSEGNQQSGLGNHYTVGYLKRFVGRHVDAGATATAAPNRVVQVLPDRWRLAYDEEDQGIKKGYGRSDFDDDAWPQVATYGKTLDGQGMPDRQTVMWYRTTFDMPKKTGNMSLFFTEVDGDATVYVNGREVGASEKKRLSFLVDISRAVRDGENVVSVRVDHSNITELFLGGIIRPVLLVETR